VANTTSPPIQKGGEIRCLRKQAGLTIIQLASEVGIGQGSLSRVELERNSINPECLQRIADALGVPVSRITRDESSALPVRTRNERDLRGRTRHSGHAMRERRLELGLSMDQVAALTGLSQSGISRYEDEYRSPRAETLDKIAHALNTTSAALMRPDEQVSDHSHRNSGVT
jgi:transcriptional regulator with XRE-family HTH domain